METKCSSIYSSIYKCNVMETKYSSIYKCNIMLTVILSGIKYVKN